MKHQSNLQRTKKKQTKQNNNDIYAKENKAQFLVHFKS